MDEQPGQQTQTQYSPDGKWWWNGAQWVAVAAPGAGPSGPGGPPRRRRRWPWFAGGAAVLVVLIGVCSVAASSSAPKTARPAAAATAVATPTAKPATAAVAARDGSCAPQPCANDNYGWVLNVSNLRYAAQGGQFENPEAGNVFVFVDVTFTNKLDQERHANPTEFVLLDGAGIKHTWRPLIDACPTWDPVNLTKGATFGPKCLSFEATGAKPAGLSLTWTPSGFGGGYNLKLS
jgi:hypothetical protein